MYHANFQPLEWTVAHRPENACYSKLVCVKSQKVRRGCCIVAMINSMWLFVVFLSI